MVKREKKVLIPEVGKSYAIGHTNYDVEQALKHSIHERELLVKINDTKNLDHQADALLELLRSRKQYLQDSLNISDAEMKQFDRKLTIDDFQFACQRVTMLVQNDSADIDDANATIDAMKSEQTSSETDENDDSTKAPDAE